jgi:hypothetical protein
MIASLRRARIGRHSLLRCIVATTIVLLATMAAQAQFTYLNQIAGGLPSGPGYLQDPFFVGGVGPAGQIVVSEGAFATGANSYTADGTFLSNLGAGTVQRPDYSAIGPDGTYYLDVRASHQVAVIDSTGNYVRALPAAGGIINPSGVVVSSAGTLYVGDSTQVEVYSTVFNGTSYPLLGSFGAAGSGPGEFGADGVGSLALDAAGANVYAADPGNNRIEVFSAAGNYVSSIGDASGPGQLNGPSSVGVSGTGLVYVTDANAGIKVFSTSGTYLETVATTVNGQTFNENSVSVAPTGMIYAAGSFNGGGGLNVAAYRFFDPGSWSSGTNSFTNANAGPTSVAVGSGQLLGTNLTLNATKGLFVGQTTTVNNQGSLIVAGGTLNTNSLIVDGGAGSANFTMTGGTLSANSITVQNGGVADFVGQPLSVALGGTVSVADAASQFKVEQGATFSATGLTNNGQVTVGPSADFIVFNNVVNSATVNLNGGELDVRGLLGNAPGAAIQGAGTLSTTAGLSNSGSLQFSGQASVFGPVDNLATGGAIEISGSQSHIFSGSVVNDGSITIDSGSSATFQGGFSGLHGTAGTGTAAFSGGLAPGDPVDMAFGGNVLLQHSNVTTMHIDGTTPGTGYDKIDVAGQLSFDGNLSVALQSFTPQVGQSFQLFTWGSEQGSFSQLTLAALPAGLSWDASLLYTQGTLRVSITGDLNGDGIVNGQDIAIIASHWLDTGTGVPGDANNDGIVNGQDIGIIASNWLNTVAKAGTSAVPEPPSIALAGLALAATLIRTRKARTLARSESCRSHRSVLLFAWSETPKVGDRGRLERSRSIRRRRA